MAEVMTTVTPEVILQAFLLAPVAGVVGVLCAWKHLRAQAVVVALLAGVQLVLAGALLLAPAAGVSVPVGGWRAPVGIELAADGLSTLMLALTAVMFAGAASYHLGQTLQLSRPARNPVYQLSFPLLLLALNGLFLTRDFFNFYVFFELLAVSSYLLVSLGKHAPLEAAWKYSAQSVVGSLCLLVGTVLMYGEAGALGMAEVAARLPEPALWAAPLFLTAFLLKTAAFPFHFWQPDAHAAATTAGSVLLAGLLIKVGLYAMLRFWPLVIGPGGSDLLVALGAASLAFGAVAAWRQADAKRLLGFSSVSQVGFVLIGIGWGTVASIGAAIFYMLHHSISKGLLFVVTGALSDRAGHTRFDALAGLGRQAPWLAAAYMLGVISLVGLPPTIGFVAKLGLLQAGAGLGAWGLVGVIVLGSFLTLAYASRAFVKLFWEPGAASPAPLAPLRWPHRLAVGAFALVVLAGALAARPVLERCEASAAQLLARPAPGAIAGGRP